MTLEYRCAACLRLSDADPCESCKTTTDAKTLRTPWRVCAEDPRVIRDCDGWVVFNAYREGQAPYCEAIVEAVNEAYAERPSRDDVERAQHEFPDPCLECGRAECVCDWRFGVQVIATGETAWFHDRDTAWQAMRDGTRMRYR